MIVTSYYANMRNLPENFVPISIARWAPKNYKGIQYKELAPTEKMLKTWKSTDNPSPSEYDKLYTECILDNLTPSKVANELYKISGNKDIALLCYEKPSDYCHRHTVAKWLTDDGIECHEFDAGSIYLVLRYLGSYGQYSSSRYTDPMIVSARSPEEAENKYNNYNNTNNAWVACELSRTPTVGSIPEELTIKSSDLADLIGYEFKSLKTIV